MYTMFDIDRTIQTRPRLKRSSDNQPSNLLTYKGKDMLYACLCAKAKPTFLTLISNKFN